MLRVSAMEAQMSDTQSHKPQHWPRRRSWAKGQSGNPAGRRPKCRNKATRAAELYLDSEDLLLISCNR
jgi:hypothetical protein